MNIPINIIVTIIISGIFIGINIFWISHINMLYLLPYLILPPISKKLFGDIGLDDDDDDDDDIEHVNFFEFNTYMMIHKEIYFKSLSSELYKGVHKHRYFKSIHRDLIPIAWHPDRYLDWCLDEEEKKDLKQLWGE